MGKFIIVLLGGMFIWGRATATSGSVVVMPVCFLPLPLILWGRCVCVLCSFDEQAGDEI